MSQTNADLVRRVEEAWAANDLSALDGLIASDLVSHDALPGAPGGLEGAKAAHQMSMASFPDRQMTIEDVIADGDRVAVRTTVQGTNTGGLPWLGVPANGRRFQIESISVYRVAGGKVVEHWGQNDGIGLMMQLGAMSPPSGGGS
jgi:predicted ester cyclase